MRACLRAIAPHQREWAEAFSAGLRRHGWQTVIRSEPEPCDLLVLWGTRQRAMIERQRKDGEICVLERGYLGDRFKWTSVSFGGELNGRAEFRGVRNEPGRFGANFGHLMKPWRKKDGYALLIGQVEGDMSLALVGGSLSAWYREMTAALTKMGRDVRFRVHPGTVKRGTPVSVPLGSKRIEGTLEDALSGASMCFTWNSNTAVESVLAGVPTMTADRGSMAWSVTTHSPGDEPITPDRTDWANCLAWCQYTLAEMASGECWEAVKV